MQGGYSVVEGHTLDGPLQPAVANARLQLDCAVLRRSGDGGQRQVVLLVDLADGARVRAEGREHFRLRILARFSFIHFVAALTRRCSFMRCILLRTILRQYEPSSLGCTTVTSSLSSEYRMSACSFDSHAAPSH